MTNPGLAPQVYTIAQVTERTGVSGDTLRSWERRHGFPRPHRSGNAYREYTDADISAIEAFLQARAQGRSVPQALREVQYPEAEPQAPTIHADDSADQISSLVTELVALDFGESEKLLRSATWTSSLASVAFDLLVPAHEEISRQRLTGSLPIASAEPAVAWIERKLAAALDISCPDQGTPTVAVLGFGQAVTPIALSAAIAISLAGMRVVVANNIQTVMVIEDICTNCSASGIIVCGATQVLEHVMPALQQSRRVSDVACMKLPNESKFDTERRHIEAFMERMRQDRRST